MNKHKIKKLDLSILLKLEITGKNRPAFSKFLNLFEELDCAQNSMYWQIIPGLNKKNFITILKSPHVNKTAQEQFEYRTYNKCVVIHTFKPSFFLLLIKILQGLSFPNITLKVTIFAEGVKFVREHLDLLELFDSKNIKLHRRLKNTSPYSKKNSNLKYTTYIELFDFYGEILCQKNTFIE
jgi:hypothetical protein